MAIRSAAKAILLHRGKILVNRCRTEHGEVYYDLPGGGQNQYEPMEDAVVREVLEETGYRVKVVRLAAIAEEIYGDPGLRERFPDYAHRISHIFFVRLMDETPAACSEPDWQQEESIWLSIREADRVPFLPKQLTGRIAQLTGSDNPQYLGCVQMRGQVF